jgi:hypothetical protein
MLKPGDRSIRVEPHPAAIRLRRPALSRRRIALSCVLACALLLCGWLVVEPAVPTRKPVRSAPPIDIETPAGRARLAAALALARMPDGPARSAAASMPLSAASGVGADDKARCGEDQTPVYAELKPDPEDGAMHPEMPVPDPDGVLRRLPGEIKAAGVGFTGAMARIDAALRDSPDPFDRSTADWLDLNKITPPPARTEALVQDALAASDARVYGLAYAACHSQVAFPIPGAPPPATPPSCARLSATRWAQLDPGNAEPWLWALDAADKRGDAAAQREALDGMAESSRLDIHFFASAAAVASLQVPDVDTTAQSMATMQALAMLSAPFSALTSRCRNRAGGDADLAATCSRIAEVMYEHSDSIIGRNIGGSLHKQVTGDASWLDRAHQEEREVGGSLLPTAADSTPCGSQRQMFKNFVRLDKVGEVALMREKLRAASAP